MNAIYRKNGTYCSDDNYKFVKQLGDGESCENPFECKSGVCISGECIGEGLIKKILNWFRKILGISPKNPVDNEEPKEIQISPPTLPN
jgi:hypothetical protein